MIKVQQVGDGIMITVRDAGTITFNPLNAHPENRAYAEFHGWKQRFVDAAAMSRDTSTGAPATPEEKFEAISALVAHYESGTEKWSRVSAGGPRGGYLFEALCRMYAVSKTPEQIRAYLDGLSDKEQAALREDDEVAPIIAEIKKEKAKSAPKMDTKALLAGLK